MVRITHRYRRGFAYLTHRLGRAVFDASQGAETSSRHDRIGCIGCRGPSYAYAGAGACAGVLHKAFSPRMREGLRQTYATYAVLGASAGGESHLEKRAECQPMRYLCGRYAIPMRSTRRRVEGATR
jgi:hypothetical protein